MISAKELLDDWPSALRAYARSARDTLAEPRLGRKDAMTICLRLSFLLSAGMPLVDCLRMLRGQTKHRAAAGVLGSLYADAEEGRSLADGMRRYPGIWPAHIIFAIEAGEQSGRLAPSLERAANDMENARALRAKVFGTLAYPAVIAVAAVMLILALTTFIFPKILPLLVGMGVALPLSTRIVLAISHAIAAWGLVFLCGCFVATAGWVIAMRRDERVRAFHDAAILRFPIAGALLRLYHVARIARMAGALIESGVSISAALSAVGRAEANHCYQYAIAACLMAVERGEGMSGQIARFPGLFPDIVSQLIYVGEQSGTLAETFSFVAQYAERDIDERAKTLAALIEPCIMISLGVAVGFVAVSIITPIYSLTGHLHAR